MFVGAGCPVWAEDAGGHPRARPITTATSKSLMNQLSIRDAPRRCPKWLNAGALEDGTKTWSVDDTGPTASSIVIELIQRDPHLAREREQRGAQQAKREDEHHGHA